MTSMKRMAAAAVMIVCVLTLAACACGDDTLGTCRVICSCESGTSCNTESELDDVTRTECARHHEDAYANPNVYQCRSGAPGVRL